MELCVFLLVDIFLFSGFGFQIFKLLLFLIALCLG